MPRPLGRNVVASVLNVVAVLGTGLLTVPLILDRVGTAGYGAWTLAVTVVLYVSILESGLGPAIQRFTAVAHGGGHSEEVGRLLVTALVAYALFGAAAAGVLIVAGEEISGIVDLPPHLRAEGEAMFRAMGVPLAIALLTAGMANVLQGLERFPPLAISAAAGAVAWLVALLALVGANELEDLAWALAIQHATVLLVRLWALRDVWLRGPRRGADRARLRAMLGFSARLQVTVFAELINWQSDKVVVAAVGSSASTLGQMGIGAQVADTQRLLAGAVLSPVTASLAVTAGGGDEDLLRDEYRRLHRLWTLGIGGLALIALPALPALIDAWLGDGYRRAAAFAMVLIAGSAFGLMTGTGIAYMRAIGQPGLEARYGLLVVGTNLALTVPLAIAFGPFGVVTGTLFAYMTGMTWFFTRLRRRVPVAPVQSPAAALKAVGAALLLGAAGAAWAHVWAGLLPAGWALAPAALGPGLALLAYARWVIGLKNVKLSSARAPAPNPDPRGM